VRHAVAIDEWRAYAAASRVTEAEATGDVHTTSGWWRLLGTRPRQVPEGALVHASVALRVMYDASYARHLPASYTYVDDDWMKPR